MIQMKYGLFGLAALAGCGGGLVDQDYPGATLTTLRGSVTTDAPLTSSGEISLALVWTSTNSVLVGRGPLDAPATPPPHVCDGTPQPAWSETTFEPSRKPMLHAQSVSLEAEFPVEFS